MNLGEIAIPIGVVFSLILGGIGYGQMKQKTDAAHRRLDDQSVRLDKLQGTLNEQYHDISEKLADLRVMVAQNLRQLPYMKPPSDKP